MTVSAVAPGEIRRYDYARTRPIRRSGPYHRRLGAARTRTRVDRTDLTRAMRLTHASRWKPKAPASGFQSHTHLGSLEGYLHLHVVKTNVIPSNRLRFRRVIAGERDQTRTSGLSRTGAVGRQTDDACARKLRDARTLACRPKRDTVGLTTRVGSSHRTDLVAGTPRPSSSAPSWRGRRLSSMIPA